MPQLAFLPWIEIDGDIHAGDFSLIRYTRGRRPRGNRLQGTLDAVLAPYHDLRGEPVNNAVILAAHGRGLTDDLSAEDRAELFLFAELFTFVALAKREFFGGWNYFNRDHLRLVIQAFVDLRGDVLMEMRRRDGTLRSWVTGDKYKVQVPAHVSAVSQAIKPDFPFLEALLAAQDRESWPGLHQGIILFNEANTDAPDMSANTELVLTYAAMEQILGITKNRDQRRFATIFADAWRPSREVPPHMWLRQPADGSWKEASLRACWASDLKICRGNLAHGHRAVQAPSRWTVDEHLLLTSFAVPRLVKHVLSARDLYELTAKDQRDINALESLLNLPDIFAKVCSEVDGEGFQDEEFAWRRVLQDEDDDMLRQFIARQLL